MITGKGKQLPWKRNHSGVRVGRLHEDFQIAIADDSKIATTLENATTTGEEMILEIAMVEPRVMVEEPVTASEIVTASEAGTEAIRDRLDVVSIAKSTEQ